jgi:hypothetical protein
MKEMIPEWKDRMDTLIAIDQEGMNAAIQSAFIAGMQLAIRLCRNRSRDCVNMGRGGEEAQNCAYIIRFVQVEIGAGRMLRPQFTKEELEEMNQIA